MIVGKRERVLFYGQGEEYWGLKKIFNEEGRFNKYQGDEMNKISVQLNAIWYPLEHSCHLEMRVLVEKTSFLWNTRSESEIKIFISILGKLCIISCNIWKYIRNGYMAIKWWFFPFLYEVKKFINLGKQKAQVSLLNKLLI